jgi:hypothetical protein
MTHSSCCKHPSLADGKRIVHQEWGSNGTATEPPADMAINNRYQELLYAACADNPYDKADSVVQYAQKLGAVHSWLCTYSRINFSNTCCKHTQ